MHKDILASIGTARQDVQLELLSREDFFSSSDSTADRQTCETLARPQLAMTHSRQIPNHNTSVKKYAFTVWL